MKILITGGAGYIGTELVQKLAPMPHVDEILIYDNLSRKNYNLFISSENLSEKIRFVQGDLLDSRKLRKSLEGIDMVVHLAAKVTTPFANEDSHQFEQINNWGTAELCYAIEEYPVKKLIYLSSMSVYGSHDDKVNPDTSPQPGTFYGISKLRGEQHVNRLADRMEVHLIRCGNVYGYNRSVRFDAVINRFMFEANFNNRVSIHGDGKQRRAFIHVGKVAHVVDRVLGGDVPPCIFNLADRNISVLELATIIKEIYPSLEFIFVDQHMKMRNLEVLPDPLLKQLNLPGGSLKEELEAFAEHFAFHNHSKSQVGEI